VANNDFSTNMRYDVDKQGNKWDINLHQQKKDMMVK
jgi:hypothetical protein